MKYYYYLCITIKTIRNMRIDKDDMMYGLMIALAFILIIYIVYIDWKWRNVVVPCLVENIF